MQNLADNKDLNLLIEAYAVNKNELESYKKLCDKENKEIKAVMSELNIDKFESDNYTAKVTVQERKSMDEDKALEVLRNSSIKGIIKTKEYIDYDALENAIYHNELDEETLAQLSVCEKVTKVPTLKLTKRKEA